jgi:hypothetical protein
MCPLLERTTLICIFLGSLAGYLKADSDRSLPETCIQNNIASSAYAVRNMTAPLIGSFAAPDSAMRGLAFDGQYLWAANSGDGNSINGPMIYRLNPDSGNVLNAFVITMNYPCGLAWDGQYLWHSLYVSGMIFQLDTAGLAILKSFTAPNTHPFDLTWFDNKLYAVRGNEPYISVIDTSDGSEVDSIHATYSSPNVRPFGLTCIARAMPALLTCDGNYGSNLVNMWSLHSSAWVDQWPGEPAIYPSGLAYDSVSERLWMSCYERDSIYIYDVSQVGIITNVTEGISGCEITARPNPFNKTTQIRYKINDPRYTIEKPSLSIYDASGRLVKLFNRESCIMNRESVLSWDGNDMYGRQLPPGIYFLSSAHAGSMIKLVKLH